jgi:hypothetical protein
MKLYHSQCTVRQPDSRNSFQLPPAAWTVGLAEIAPDANLGTGRNDLNLGLAKASAHHSISASSLHKMNSRFDEMRTITSGEGYHG